MNVQPESRSPTLLRPILLGGVLAGIGDLAFAFTYYGLRDGATPPGVLQSIAAGLLGTDAHAGGWGTMLLGLVLHFMIAAGAAAVFCLASRNAPALLRHFVISGLAYGVAVYLVMTYIVLPLSAFPFPTGFSLPSLLAHMILVGLPIAYAAGRCASRPGE